MALYRVHFVDRHDDIYRTIYYEHDSDEAAIEEGHRRNVVPFLAAGFEVWQDDRFVYEHRN